MGLKSRHQLLLSGLAGDGIHRAWPLPGLGLRRDLDSRTARCTQSAATQKAKVSLQKCKTRDACGYGLELSVKVSAGTTKEVPQRLRLTRNLIDSTGSVTIPCLKGSKRDLEQLRARYASEKLPTPQEAFTLTNEPPPLCSRVTSHAAARQRQ